MLYEIKNRKELFCSRLNINQYGKFRGSSFDYLHFKIKLNFTPKCSFVRLIFVERTKMSKKRQLYDFTYFCHILSRQEW